MRKKIFVILSVTLCLSGAASADWAFDFQPAVTPLAEAASHIHDRFMGLILALFAMTMAVMAYALFYHRKDKGYTPATFTRPTTPLEWVLTVLPFVGLIYLDYVWIGIPAYYAASNLENTQEGAELVLKVTSSQWKWQYEYPEQHIRFISSLSTPPEQINQNAQKDANYLLEVDNPVVLPVNKKIRILLMSSDVMHAWSVPSFGVKRATIPGFLRETWVKIEKEGVYRGQCTQICGKNHAFMPIVVQAVSQAQFDAWVLTKQSESTALGRSTDSIWTKEALMKQGQGVYEKICIACHMPGGVGIPGVFPALAGSNIVNSPFLDANGRLVKDGHLDRVLNGKQGTAMQAFKETLSDLEIAGVVTYERNSFGNTMGDRVQPAQVKALR